MTALEAALLCLRCIVTKASVKHGEETFGLAPKLDSSR